jgi:hypothetical protein
MAPVCSRVSGEEMPTDATISPWGSRIGAATHRTSSMYSLHAVRPGDECRAESDAILHIRHPYNVLDHPAMQRGAEERSVRGAAALTTGEQGRTEDSGETRPARGRTAGPATSSPRFPLHDPTRNRCVWLRR